jgi:hypothetical protein
MAATGVLQGGSQERVRQGHVSALPAWFLTHFLVAQEDLAVGIEVIETRCSLFFGVLQRDLPVCAMLSVSGVCVSTFVCVCVCVCGCICPLYMRGRRVCCRMDGQWGHLQH